MRTPPCSCRSRERTLPDRCSIARRSPTASQQGKNGGIGFEGMQARRVPAQRQSDRDEHKTRRHAQPGHDPVERLAIMPPSRRIAVRPGAQRCGRRCQDRRGCGCGARGSAEPTRKPRRQPRRLRHRMASTRHSTPSANHLPIRSGAHIKGYLASMIFTGAEPAPPCSRFRQNPNRSRLSLTSA
jgi:hypothetical protein